MSGNSTLLLDRTFWDLCIDVNGNIAVATLPYAAAQDAASACRLFQGEYWYDTTIGIPYFEQILGQTPPINLVRSQMQEAADSVPAVGTGNSQVYFSSIASGQLSGQVQVTIGDTTLAASF